MTSARAEARPRAGAGGAWWPALGIAAIWIFLGIFLIYPLARIFYDAFSDDAGRLAVRDRKSTRLNSSHSQISYAGFCLKKKTEPRLQQLVRGQRERVRDEYFVRSRSVYHSLPCFFFFNDTATTEIYTLSLHDALPISAGSPCLPSTAPATPRLSASPEALTSWPMRSEEHTSELQSQSNLVCRLLL